MNSLSVSDKRRVEIMARKMVEDSKRKMRAVKKWVDVVKRTIALPIPLTMFIANNYTNPVTLTKPPYGVAVYMLTNSKTGRKNYYNKKTIIKLASLKNEYSLLMANRKVPLFKNPMTRSNVYAKNLQRVIVKPKKKTPSPTSAAKKIQSAVRKHLSKKKPKRVSK